LGIVVAIVMVPTLLITAYRILPKTRFGRRVILAPPVRERGEAIPDTAELVKLLGQTGQVVTPLRPVGMCMFAGRRVESVAESGYIQKGTVVKVIRVEGTQLTVRATEEA
jgi:membrane-bound serine protease (ClpP class)